MPPGQHYASMIHFGLRARGASFRQTPPLEQRASAGRAPVRLSLLVKHRVALAANPFHSYEITGLGLLSTSAAILPSASR